MFEIDKNKKTIFSAVQPSGFLTLGNYLGAIKNWINFQDNYNCIFSLADLHTITVKQNPKDFHDRIIELYALFLACGVNPEKSIFFIQSHVHTHAELSWILSCFTYFGELSRMTQFKDKSQKYENNINSGLFTYPCLMAADILLYQADIIPVGADQKQHIELTRDIAIRFNNLYGDIFKIPEDFIPKAGARIMSLQNPEKKMSKSDENANSYIALLDSPDIIVKKVKKAVTDSNNLVKFTDKNTGIDNLINIYSSLTNKKIVEIEQEFENSNYGIFKNKISEKIVETLNPIQEKFNYYIKSKDYLEINYKKSAEMALEISQKTLNKVKESIGFLSL